MRGRLLNGQIVFTDSRDDGFRDNRDCGSVYSHPEIVRTIVENQLRDILVGCDPLEVESIWKENPTESHAGTDVTAPSSRRWEELTSLCGNSRQGGGQAHLVPATRTLDSRWIRAISPVLSWSPFGNSL